MDREEEIKQELVEKVQEKLSQLDHVEALNLLELDIDDIISGQVEHLSIEELIKLV